MILAVDDKKEICRLIQVYLSDKYEVITRNNGLEAFGFLQEGNIPDAIISDIQMPGIDGYELLTQVRVNLFAIRPEVNQFELLIQLD